MAATLLRLVSLLCLLWQLGGATLQLYAVAVGQGDSNIILCPNQQDIVIIDIGATRPVNVHPDYVTNLLKSRFHADKNGMRIHILVTHSHIDHYGYIYRAIDSALAANVQQVVLSDTFSQYNENFRNWLHDNIANVYSINSENKCFGNTDCKLTAAKGFDSSDRYLDPASGDPWQLCGADVQFNVLGANIGSNPNSRSLILKLIYKSWSVFMAGDFEEVTPQKELLNTWSPEDFHATYYKVAHHGAWTSKQANLPLLLAAVRAEKAYMSQGYPDLSMYHHPNCETVDHLQAVGTIHRLSNANMNAPFVCWNSTLAKTTVRTGFAYEIYETCRKLVSNTTQVCQDILIESDGSGETTSYIDAPPLYSYQRPRKLL